MSAFHLDGEMLQESSRASTTDAIILYNVKKRKSLLSVTVSGVLATRQRTPSRLIDRIWIKREVPIKRRDGRTVLSRRWITFADRGAGKMRITGWFGVQKSGFS